jgi:hypothetical protein
LAHDDLSPLIAVSSAPECDFLDPDGAHSICPTHR